MADAVTRGINNEFGDPYEPTTTYT